MFNQSQHLNANRCHCQWVELTHSEQNLLFDCDVSMTVSKICTKTLTFSISFIDYIGSGIHFYIIFLSLLEGKKKPFLGLSLQSRLCTSGCWKTSLTNYTSTVSINQCHTWSQVTFWCIASSVGLPATYFMVNSKTTLLSFLILFWSWTKVRDDDHYFFSWCCWYFSICGIPLVYLMSMLSSDNWQYNLLENEIKGNN